MYRSPGYGLTLVSESTSGVMHSAEGSTHTSHPHSNDLEDEDDKDKASVKHVPTLPEDIGKQTAVNLIEEIVKVCCYEIITVLITLGVTL